MRVSVVDRLEIADKRTTSAGYLAVRAKIARDGVYQYARKDVGLEGDPNEIVGVYRSHDWVFDESNLASFAHKPVCIGHPGEQVNSTNWKKLAVGQIGDKVWEAEDRKHVQVDLLLMDQAGIDAAQSSHRELSAGYSCDILPERGISPDGESYEAIMTGKMTVDHLGLVPRGRAGSQARIGDAWPEIIEDSNREKEETVKTIVIDSIPYTVENLDGLEAAVNKVIKAKEVSEKALADAQAKAATEATNAATSLADATAKVATLEATVATLQTELADAQSPEKLAAAVQARAGVIAKAKALGAEVTDSMSEADIRKTVVQKRLGDTAKDWTDAQIAVSFDTLSATVKDAATDPYRLAMGDRQVVDFGDAKSQALAARAKRNAELYGTN